MRAQFSVGALSGSVTSDFPISVSANGRYLVNPQGTPVLMLGGGDAQCLAQQLPATVTQWCTDRASYGVNALWVHTIINDLDGGNAQGKTADGIAPFTAVLSGSLSDPFPNYDLTAPNPTYFSRLDQVINIAASFRMVVFLDMMENDSYMSVYQANGNSRMSTFGTYLANRYKSFPNVVFMTGNDFQTYTNPTDNALAQQLMQAVATNAPSAQQTIELNFNMSGGSDDPTLYAYTTIDPAYTYYPVYYQVLKEYNVTPAKPVFMIESYYEGFTYGNLTPTSANNLMLRKIAYWSPLSGALGGYWYGSIWYRFPTGWAGLIDTVAMQEAAWWRSFFTSFANWYLLVPDTAHAVVTAGYGTATGNLTGNIQTDTYVTAASVPDGSLALAYCPVSTTLTVDMTKLRGSTTARWFDPTNNTYSSISGSPFANTGTHNFATPGNNSTGDPDWVLVLQA